MIRGSGVTLVVALNVVVVGSAVVVVVVGCCAVVLVSCVVVVGGFVVALLLLFLVVLLLLLVVVVVVVVVVCFVHPLLAYLPQVKQGSIPVHKTVAGCLMGVGSTTSHGQFSNCTQKVLIHVFTETR